MRTVDIKFNDDETVDVALDIKGLGNYIDIVKNFPETKLKEFYQNKILNTPPIVLPPAVRYVSRRKNMVIWEQPPGYRNIHYTTQKAEKINVDSQSKYQFRIPIPWQVYIVYFSPQYTISNIYMFFRGKPLSTTDTALYAAPLHNFYADYKLCQAAYSDIPTANNLFQLLGNVYNMIWESGFNNDLVDAVKVSPLFGILGNTFGNNMGEYYQKWSQLDLKTVVEKTKWPKAHDDIAWFINQAEHETSYDVVQFISDIQDAIGA